MNFVSWRIRTKYPHRLHQHLLADSFQSKASAGTRLSAHWRVVLTLLCPHHTSLGIFPFCYFFSLPPAPSLSFYFLLSLRYYTFKRLCLTGIQHDALLIKENKLHFRILVRVHNIDCFTQLFSLL